MTTRGHRVLHVLLAVLVGLPTVAVLAQLGAWQRLGAGIWTLYAAFWYGLDAVLPPTVQPVEIIWVLANVVGLGFYSRWYALAWRQRRRERARGINGARSLVLATRCARFLCLALAFECWVGVGAIAMLQRPGQSGASPSPEGLVAVVLLFAGPTVLVFKGFWVNRIEAALRRLLDLREDATGARHA